MTERAETDLEGPVVADGPPMPEVARAAAAEALAGEPELEPSPAVTEGPPPVHRRKKKKRGPRSRLDLLRENRELLERAKEKGIDLRPPKPPKPPRPEAGPQAEPAAPSPELGTLEPAPLPAVTPPLDASLARDFAYSLLRFIFKAVAVERGRHWELDEADRGWTDQLGNGLAPYLPNLGAALPWLLGGMGLVSAIQQRVSEDKRLKGGGLAKSEG